MNSGSVYQSVISFKNVTLCIWFDLVNCFRELCCALLCVHSSFAIILMGKRDLVVLLSLFSLVSFDCWVALPHDATGLSAFWDCRIS